MRKRRQHARTLQHHATLRKRIQCPSTQPLPVVTGIVAESPPLLDPTISRRVPSALCSRPPSRACGGHAKRLHDVPPPARRDRARRARRVPSALCSHSAVTLPSSAGGGQRRAVALCVAAAARCRGNKSALAQGWADARLGEYPGRRGEREAL
jgi:hypothetical protein